MIILGVETSCDETAASVIRAERGKIKILSNVVSSQVELFKKWGGVVPNLAAREHLKNIVPVLNLALKKAGLSPEKIDLISVTQGPGLIPALLIGVDTAKTLSYIWKKPLLGIHHIEGHIYANFIGDKISASSKLQIPNPKQIQNSGIKFPILCLVVSGGHTQLVLMKKHLDYEIIGQTLDDAAGEAFDKVARILGLGYPGGPAISQLAAKWKSQITNHKSQKNSKLEITLPRPMINKDNFDFSFSGLKTAVLYAARNLKLTTYNKQLLAKEFQQATIDVLVHKTIKAAKKYHPKTIMLAGGVSANQELRKQMKKAVKNNCHDSLFIIPDLKYCIDNATMIAAAASFRWKKMSAAQKKKSFNTWKTLKANANLKMK